MQRFCPSPSIYKQLGCILHCYQPAPAKPALLVLFGHGHSLYIILQSPKLRYMSSFLVTTAALSQETQTSTWIQLCLLNECKEITSKGTSRGTSRGSSSGTRRLRPRRPHAYSFLFSFVSRLLPIPGLYILEFSPPRWGGGKKSKGLEMGKEI